MSIRTSPGRVRLGLCFELKHYLIPLITLGLGMIMKILCYRLWNQEHGRKNVSMSKETSSEAVNKCAGVGWKGCRRVSPSFHMENKLTRVPGESWELRNSSSVRELKDASTSRGETSYAYKSTEECKPLGHDPAKFRDLEYLRISDPRQRVNSFQQPFGRARQVDGCFRQSNEGDYQRDCSFRQPYQLPNAWSARTYSGSNSNQEWRASSVQSAPSSSSWTVPHGNHMGTNQRYHNQLGEPAGLRVANSFHGRGRYASNSGFDTSYGRGRGRGRGFDASSAKRDGRW